MKRDEKFVITINRELGSGGRTVGERLAAKLGVPFYDKAVIKAMEEKYHLTLDEIEKLKGREQSWWSDFDRVVSIGPTNRAQYYRVEMGSDPELLTTEEMFKVEKEILVGTAEEGSCVIAGRSGFFVFHTHPNHLSILIQAPLEKRVERLLSKQSITEDEARAIIYKVDKMRENYVNKYTGTSRYDTRNYDLVINMDGLSEDDAVALIMDYIDKSSK